MNRTGADARVLAAALRTWAHTTDSDPRPDHKTAARVVIRQPPAWGYVTTVPLTRPQTRRLMDRLRDDLTDHPQPTQEPPARPGWQTRARNLAATCARAIAAAATWAYLTVLHRL